MEYLPTFRLSFPDGTFNEYRLRENQIEFLTSDGTWRILSDEDVFVEGFNFTVPFEL